jgi:hypothetical protein
MSTSGVKQTPVHIQASLTSVENAPNMGGAFPGAGLSRYDALS